MTADAKPTKIILSLPRCGTHFFWSRLVASGQYRLIYDADRVPALKVLAEHNTQKLSFLHPPARNLNYNFQYNSLAEAPGAMTAAEHLDFLSRRYGASDPQELFKAIMDRQDRCGQGLFSINRFCYTISYRWLAQGLTHTIEHALESLGLLHDWMMQYDPAARFVMVIRQIPQWIDSLLLLWGDENRSRIAQALADFPAVVQWCRQRGVPIFRMGEAIRCVNRGTLDFETRVPPLSAEALDAMIESSRLCLKTLDHWPPVRNGLRLGRFIEYLCEKDPVLRTSLVRSIGTVPYSLGKIIRPLGRRIRTDFDGLILDNARLI
ncbi:MAG: hypothetical protein LLG01_05895 [Planctomycetaceae bacterium]|nr:hypothetical protein [Planctomycetaceae bacterium]